MTSKAAINNLVEAQKEHDLEVWRQAYNAALAGYEIQRIFFEKYNCELYSPVERADQALGFYRAKREELMKTQDANVKLYAICEQFIADNEITCPETIYQTDRVSAGALKFIEKVCENVGYAREDEDA